MKKLLNLLTFFVLILVSYSIVLAQTPITLEHTKVSTILVQDKEVPIVIGQRNERIENLRNKLRDATQKILDGLPDHVKNKHNKWEYGLTVGESPNAYGGGGGIYFDYRYMESLSDNEIAFVIAHEIGHSVLGHGGKEVIPIEEKLGARLSRIDEKSADRFAVAAMKKAGYSSDEIRDGATKFFESLKAKDIPIRNEKIYEYSKYILEQEWPTHPSAIQRLEEVGNRIINLEVNEAIRRLDETKKQLEFSLATGPKTALAPTDASKLSLHTAGDIQVNVTFTQELSGLYTQTPDSFLSRGAGWNMTNISGTRTGEGSIPGNFTTGSGSGRVEAYPGYAAGTINNADFAITTQGRVSASGKAGQPLTGTMSSTFNTTDIENVSLRGPVTLNPNGSLKWENFSGEVRHSGVQVGTMTGSVNQGPTR